LLSDKRIINGINMKLTKIDYYIQNEQKTVTFPVLRDISFLTLKELILTLIISLHVKNYVSVKIFCWDLAGM